MIRNIFLKRETKKPLNYKKIDKDMKTEKKLQQIIEDQLFWDSRVASANIKVDVMNEGIMKLYGSVPSYADKRNAELDTLSISGVNRIDNQLSVKRDEEKQLPMDEEIRQVIRMILEWNAQIDDSDMVVKVQNSIVELEGSVKTSWEKEKCEELASPVKGVTGVINKLAVVPTKDIADEVIAKDIVNALERNTFVDIDTIDVNVKDGQVTLTGKVSSQMASKYAYETALYTPNVISVNSHLELM